MNHNFTTTSPQPHQQQQPTSPPPTLPEEFLNIEANDDLINIMDDSFFFGEDSTSAIPPPSSIEVNDSDVKRKMLICELEGLHDNYLRKRNENFELFKSLTESIFNKETKKQCEEISAIIGEIKRTITNFDSPERLAHIAAIKQKLQTECEKQLKFETYAKKKCIELRKRILMPMPYGSSLRRLRH